MPISLPANVARDIRQPILGDSFNWYAIEPGAAKRRICIHATASETDLEDGFTMADYHVNHNGWGGIGVHFVITKDGYPGKPGFTDPGAQVQYVGDLLTERAGVANNNNGTIHIEIVGLFTTGVPQASQLRLTRALIDHLLTQTPELPSLNYYNQVTYHNAMAIQPDGGTACPGWQNPLFNDWFSYLTGGAFPDHLYAVPEVIPPAPIPEPVVIPVTPPDVVIAPVDWHDTWQVDPSLRPILRTGAYAEDVTTGVRVSDITVGLEVNVAGYFTKDAIKYARTVWSVTNNKWNGIPESFFEATGQPQGDVTVTVNPATTVTATPPGTTVIDGVQSPVSPSLFEDTPQALQDAFLGLDPAVRRSFLDQIIHAFAFIISPLLKLLGKKGL